MQISIDYDKSIRSRDTKNLLKGTIIASAILLNLSPAFLKDHLNRNALLSLSLSGVAASLACCKLPSTEHEDKLIKTYKDTHLKTHRLVLQGDISKIQSTIEIENQREIAEIIEGQPEHQTEYFGAKYGVSPIMYRGSVEPEETPNIPQNTPIIIPNYEATIERAESQSGVIFDWMRNAVTKSVYLAGAKGSGKTYFMKWLLSAYIENMSKVTDTFYICDPHYDDADWDDPWVSKDFDSKLIESSRLGKTEAQTLSIFKSVVSAFEIRKKKSLTIKKGVGHIRLFIDEVDSYSEEAREVILPAIRVIENEARKYGITVVLGAHSIKKGETGIDSSLINSMVQVIFADVVLDGNSVLSNAYPAMPTRRTQINKMLTEYGDDCRVVYVCDGRKAFISYIPDIVIPSYVEATSTSPETVPETPQETPQETMTPYEGIAKWCRLCYETHGRYPTPEHLRQAWKDYTGKELHDGGLQLLREWLYKAQGIEI
jgi:hypothetical protein